LDDEIPLSSNFKSMRDPTPATLEADSEKIRPLFFCDPKLNLQLEATVKSKPWDANEINMCPDIPDGTYVNRVEVLWERNMPKLCYIEKKALSYGISTRSKNIFP
jgi:hypothetical protein